MKTSLEKWPLPSSCRQYDN